MNREWRLYSLGWSLYDAQLDKGVALVSTKNALARWIGPDGKLHQRKFETVEAAKLAVEVLL
jgi:hypothetical protein